MSSSNCANSGRKPFSRLLYVGGNNETISSQIVPDVVDDNMKRAFGSFPLAVSVQENFFQSVVKPETFASAYLTDVLLSSVADNSPLNEASHFAKKVNLYVRPLTTFIPQNPVL